MIKLFIGKPEIKHINNKVIITVYTYNRKKIYFLNKIKRIFNINSHSVNKFSPKRSKSNVKNNLITRSNKKLFLVKNKKLDFICTLQNKKNSLIKPQVQVNTSYITQGYNPYALAKKSNINILTNSHGDKDKTLVVANPLQKRFIHNFKKNTSHISHTNDKFKNKLKLSKSRSSAGSANKLKFLKIRLNKRKKVLFNIIKNNPTSFFFVYIASQLVKTSTSCPTKKKLTKTTDALLSNSPSQLQSLYFRLSKIAFNKSKRASYASFVKKNAILKKKIIQIQPILKLVYPSNLRSLATLMELKKKPLTQT